MCCLSKTNKKHTVFFQKLKLRFKSENHILVPLHDQIQPTHLQEFCP